MLEKKNTENTKQNIINYVWYLLQDWKWRHFVNPETNVEQPTKDGYLDSAPIDLEKVKGFWFAVKVHRNRISNDYSSPLTFDDTIVFNDINHLYYNRIVFMLKLFNKMYINMYLIFKS